MLLKYQARKKCVQIIVMIVPSVVGPMLVTVSEHGDAVVNFIISSCNSTAA